MNQITCPRCRDTHFCPVTPGLAPSVPAVPDPWQVGPVHQFIAERCVRHHEAAASCSAVYRGYLVWCREVTRLRPLGVKRFTTIVTDMGRADGSLSRVKRSVMWWRGLALDLPRFTDMERLTLGAHPRLTRAQVDAYVSV